MIISDYLGICVLRTSTRGCSKMHKKRRCYRIQEIAQEKNGVTGEEEGGDGAVCTSPGVGRQS
jgi:hypothetical protein